MGAASGSSGFEDAEERVVLAHVPPFAIGALAIEPARLRVARDDREEFLQPRVMQVLVVLARDAGEILSRDDLVRRCWEGRIVGDDAIHRVLAQLRRLSQGLGAGVFTIETVPRVGYRLILIEAPVRSETTLPSQPPRSWRTRRVAIAATSIAVIVAASLLFLRAHEAAASIPTVAVQTQVLGPEAAALARDLGSDLSRLAGARASDLSVLDSSKAGAADYLVRIGAERRGASLHAELTLIDRSSGALLWSATFDRAASERPDLRQQIAVKLDDVLLCTLHGNGGTGERLDSATLRLFLNYCDRVHDTPGNGQLELIRQVTQRAPGFARGWANLAITEANVDEKTMGHATRDEGESRVRLDAARQHLLRARVMDPTLSETYVAEALLITDPRRWADRLAIYERGLSVESAAPLYEARADELMRVGRMKDAIESARRSVALDPLSPSNRNILVSALVYSGDTAGARAALIEAERIWPGAAPMRDMRFRFDLRFGDAAAALRMVDDPAFSDITDPAEYRASLAAFLRARINPTQANIIAAIGTASGNGITHSLFGAHLQTLAYFGRVDEAYRLMSLPEVNEFRSNGTEMLFRPGMKSIRRDRRFIAFAKQMGLLDYWRTTDKWPDFCGEADLPYDCKAEARRIG